MTKKFCDRCGAYLQTLNIFSAEIVNESPLAMSFGNSQSERNHYDLCKKCANDTIRFILGEEARADE